MVDSVSETAGGLADLKKARRQTPVQKTDADRLPPHAPEAEQGVLGCVLMSPTDCLPQVIEVLPQGADVFYDLRHQTIYSAMLDMFDKRKPIDVITVQQHLKDCGMLEQVGGIPYLNALQDCVPSASNVTYYTSIVHEKYLMRLWVQRCSDIVGKIYDYEGDVSGLMDDVERDVIKLVDSRSGTRRTRTAKELVVEATRIMERAMESGGANGIMTGFPDFDKLTCGLMPGDMIVIGARPSTGKTSLAMNIAEHVAINQRIPVGVFSLEMTAESLVLRTLCSVARVNLRDIRSGYITESDAVKLTPAAAKVANAPLFIDDTPGLTITQLRAKARRMAQLHGVKLFIIDYLQLLHAPTRGRDDGRQQEITRISEGIKALAKELNVPVIVLSQLNRELEKGAGKKGGSRKPRMSDLRESGAIEQDADLIALLYKSEDEDADTDVCPTNLDIAKQRNGPTDVVHLTFMKKHTRFESAAKVTDEDVPRE